MSGPSNLDREAYIYICSNCSRPTLVVPDQPYSPRPKPGDNVPNLPEPVAKLYDEIRASIQAGAYTGAILLARTLINHVAFDQCGTEGTFKKQIEALDKERLLPKGSKEWVDEMKDIGNEVTHELKICDPETAEHVLSFTHMLLSLVYDFPNRVPKPPI